MFQFNGGEGVNQYEIKYITPKTTLEEICNKLQDLLNSSMIEEEEKSRIELALTYLVIVRDSLR